MQTHLEGINQMYNLMYRSDILYKKKRISRGFLLKIF